VTGPWNRRDMAGGCGGERDADGGERQCRGRGVSN
jgi:hypothetical protein